MPLYKILTRKYKLDKGDIFFGVDGSSEYYLASGNNYYFLYDFTILSKRIIIEYNNLRWHPNKEYMSEDEWKKWRVGGRVGEVNADEKCRRDKFKRDVAIENGFKYLEIWNFDSYGKNMDKMITFIKEYIGT